VRDDGNENFNNIIERDSAPYGDENFNDDDYSSPLKRLRSPEARQGRGVTKLTLNSSAMKRNSSANKEPASLFGKISNFMASFN
jgi:hypothetical protein